MKIAIIGGGAAGLDSLRHCLRENHECELFEQTGVIGGTWNYTDKTDRDEFGLPIHSSMYQGLRTNLPKELMHYEDFPYETLPYSYLSQEEVLKYINKFAKTYNLFPYIKMFRHVTRISPLEQGRWQLKVKDLKLQTTETKEYDAVFVCVGNYSVPFTPDFPGIEKFQGIKIHSHVFRNAEVYRNKKVLVIGSGSSGLDISRHIQKFAKQVILSHRSPINPRINISDTIKRKPEIQYFTEHSVVFKDGSEIAIDEIIFCTGYLYTFPFLSKDCQIEVDKQWVKYLYKHIININHPTMAFIGIPFRIAPFLLFGIQVRFFLSFLRGGFKKSKDEMMTDLLNYINKRKENNVTTPPHFIGITQGEYMYDLATIAKVKKVPPVYAKLYHFSQMEGKEKWNYVYKIVNDEEFSVTEVN